MKSIFEVNHVHFIGIGGISMSSIAGILLAQGKTVSGSDQANSPTVKQLSDEGANIAIGHSAANITTPDIVVYTGAIAKDNPEMLRAIEKNIPLVPRTVALNDILQLHENIIAVAGTHGKTTTTSMITEILRGAFADVSYLIGAHLHSSGKAYHLAKSPIVTVEACEYQANFLNLYPTSLLINNIEPEHIDYYKTIEQLTDTFKTFAGHLPNDKPLVVNIDDKNCRKLLTLQGPKIVSFSLLEAADYQARHLRQDAAGKISFDLYIAGEQSETITLPLIGKFNAYNALGAIAICHQLGIDILTIKRALASFVNSDRRFEALGYYRDVPVISDYAHHPSEVRATLSDASKIAGKSICVVFQPHTYSRLKTMLADFATSFHGVDHVLVTDIYAAREQNSYHIHASDLVEAIKKQGQTAHYIGALEQVPAALQGKLTDHSIIIMMGAGSIDQYARKLVQQDETARLA